MRILVINWRDILNPLGGGAEVHLFEIFSRLVDRGHSITMVANLFPGAKREEMVQGIRVVRGGGEYTFPIVAPRLVMHELAKQRYDVIVEDINKLPLYTPLWVRLPKLIIIPHIFGGTIFQQANVVVGGIVYVSELPLVPIYKREIFEVISNSTKEDLVGRGIPKENVEVIECGIDHTLYSPGGGKAEDPLVVYVGRLKKYKGVDHLIKAMVCVQKEVPNATLVIVGDGDYKRTLERIAVREGVKARFTGFVPQEEKVDWLRKAWVVVYPSRIEGWGLVAIEANACGTPVIASRVPGLRDSVKDGVSGLLYPYGDINKMSSLIVRLLKDRRERERLSQGALRWASNFTWGSAANGTEALLHRIKKRRL